MSTVVSPAARNELRPTLPYVPGAGTENAFGLNQPVGLPRITGPLKLGLRFGRSGTLLSPSRELLNPTVGVNGRPFCAVMIAFSFQPLTSLSAAPGMLLNQALPAPIGRS